MFMKKKQYEIYNIAILLSEYYTVKTSMKNASFSRWLVDYTS